MCSLCQQALSVGEDESVLNVISEENFVIAGCHPWFLVLSHSFSSLSAQLARQFIQFHTVISTNEKRPLIFTLNTQSKIVSQKLCWGTKIVGTFAD